MFVVISAVRFYQVGLVVMRVFVEITVRLYETGPVNRLARIIADDEFDIGFVKVTQLWRKRMADILVGDYHFGRHPIAAGNLKVTPIDRSDKFFGRRARGLSPERKDVDTQRIVLEKLVDGAQLIRPFVESRDGRVSGGPAMRDQRAFLRRYVEERRRFAFHMAGITGLFVAHIERMRRLF